MTDRRAMRFRWRRAHVGKDGCFDAHLGRWFVAHLAPYTTAGGNKTLQTQWFLTTFCHFRALNQLSGIADDPRRAAEKAEAAFSRLVLTQDRYDMATEDEILFRGVLGIPLTPRLEHDIRVKAGEHLIPFDPNEGELASWLAIERAAGRRYWISPEDMKAWYGDRWEDPRKKSLANLSDPGPSSPRRHGSRIRRRSSNLFSDTDPTSTP